MIRTLSAASLLTATLMAQTPGPKPEFEVADIRQNKSNEKDYATELPGGQISVRNKSLKDMIAVAFTGRPDTPVLGAPAWIATDRFDITGKAHPGTPDELLAEMLKNLLIKQFKLEAHVEQRPADTYALVAGKGGSRLVKAAGSGKAECHARTGDNDDPKKREAVQAELVCTNVTMADLAANLRRLVPAYVDHDVVDMTGISGSYDVVLNWTPAALIDQGGLTLFDAITRQLGLRLEARKLPRPAIVIDHVEKLPDDN